MDDPGNLSPRLKDRHRRDAGICNKVARHVGSIEIIGHVISQTRFQGYNFLRKNPVLSGTCQTFNYRLGQLIGTAMSDFCGLLEAQIPPLRRYARALLRDASRADDLIQDTLVRALAKQHLWQEGTNLRAWLFTLMHNLHVNVVRQSAREGTLVDVDDVSATLIATSDPSVSRQLRELEEAIARLPVEQREVV